LRSGGEPIVRGPGYRFMRTRASEGGPKKKKHQSLLSEENGGELKRTQKHNRLGRKETRGRGENVFLG